MLPGIRAIIAAVVMAAGLLMVSFGLVATFRVAQDNRAGSLQADLAQRGRAPVLAGTGPRAILIVEAPAPPVPPPSVAESPVPEQARHISVAETNEAPVIEAPAVTLAAVEAPAIEVSSPLAPPAEPAPQPQPSIGGPLQMAVLPTEPPREATEIASKASEKTARKAAAKKARAARMARERKARRAAQARRAQENTAAPFGNFGGTFNQ